MIRRQHVVREFFADAEAMRDTLDVCFRNAYTNSIDWHYFCDPRMYTYLRTTPTRVFPKAILNRFLECLRFWCVENLGLVPMGMPGLHLMVNGCRLGLHSDFQNGTWGYVYSLTRWDERKFSGGETLLLRDGIPSYKKHHVHGEVLFELVPAYFNQLLVFDDRIVHGTPTIEGSMDPLEARIALVGHIRAGSPLVNGNIAPAEVCKVILESLPRMRDLIRHYSDVQGTIAYRLAIAPGGAVESVTVLTDNVITQYSGYEHSDAVAAVKSAIHRTMTGLRFPSVPSNSRIIIPLLIPIPDLRPIEIVVSHESSVDEVCERARAYFEEDKNLELQGSWQGGTFIVREPIQGSIVVDAHQIAALFDPPMWVPSQRERFQRTLKELASSVASATRT